MRCEKRLGPWDVFVNGKLLIHNEGTANYESSSSSIAIAAPAGPVIIAMHTGRHPRYLRWYLGESR